jgi:DNA-binding transcriptional LysR family regulator
LSVEQWRLFVQIADCGSLTQAAATRDVAQSAISRQLAAIETACGGRLFERLGRGVRLSQAGQAIYPKVSAWLEVAEQLTQEVRGVLSEPGGSVRFGVLASVAETFIGSVYRQVRDAFPGVRLHIVSGTSGLLLQALEAGQLDLALLSRNPREQHGHELVVATVEHLLVGSPGDSLTRAATVPFERLDGIALVVPSRPYRFHQLLEHWAQRKGITLRVAAECDSLSIQKHLVATSGLYAIMASSAVQEDVSAGRLQAARIVSPVLKRKLVLLTSDAHPPSAACREVLRIAHQQVLALLDGGSLALDDGLQGTAPAAP